MGEKAEVKRFPFQITDPKWQSQGENPRPYFSTSLSAPVQHHQQGQSRGADLAVVRFPPAVVVVMRLGIHYEG